MNEKYPGLLERFLSYVKINTRSNEQSDSIPSDQKEIDFVNDLKTELVKIGFSDVRILKDGYLFANIPASKGKENTTPIGFISHVDTADFNAENVMPNIIENYDGKSIIQLNSEQNIKLDPSVFPNLKKYKGQTLITTDGTTLLGADDKAGVVEIISAMKYIIEHPEFSHGPISIAFGPDEEIGIGANNFDVADFGAKYAYTIDGGSLGELEWETFSGAGVDVKAKGIAVHPGEAYGKLVNPIELLIELDQFFPKNERPETTKDREGYYYLMSINGDVDSAESKYIIRDFDRNLFNKRKDFFQSAVDSLNKKYNDNLIEAKISDQYFNMGEVLKNDMKPVEIAKKSMENIGIEPVVMPVRGGTDGSKITFLGLPTPNIFSGAENMHGRYEYVSLQTMEKATDTILEIVKTFALD